MRLWKLGNLVLVLCGLIPAIGAQARDHGGLCEFVDGHFRVNVGGTIRDQYVGSADPARVRVSCGRSVSAAIAGDYFVVFDGANFVQKYIGISSGEQRIKVDSGFGVAGAIMGDYFVLFDGRTIDSKYVGVSSSERRLDIAAGRGVVTAIMGDYFVAGGPGRATQSKYIGFSSSDARVAMDAGDSIAAAAMGDYFVTYVNGKIDSKYIGYSSSARPALLGRGRLVIASLGDYFVVLDGARAQVQSKYVGNPGRLWNDGNRGTVTTSSSTYAYSLVSGKFE